MKTLDEAIQIETQNMEETLALSEKMTNDPDLSVSLKEKSQYFSQLVDWLKQLKALQDDLK